MSWVTAIDTTLDRSIALGYGNVGLELRSRLPGWPADPPRMDGKVVLVTGAASGLGLASARGFAELGARVVAVARSEQRSEDARAQILETAPRADVVAVAADVSSVEAAKQLARHVEDTEASLDVLVNNAGVMPEERQRSAEGHELTFATHVLVPFALTALLEPRLAASAPARVINVSSGGMYSQPLPQRDFESEQDNYSPARFYARTKREQLVITELWAERLATRGVVVHAMHPGWAATKGVKDSLPLFDKVTRPIIRSPAQGADTIIWLGAAPEAVNCTGRFWQDRRPRPTHYALARTRSSDTPQARAALWEHCQSLLVEAGIELSAGSG